MRGSGWKVRWGAAVTLSAITAAVPVFGFPGVLVGKGGNPGVTHATHVVIMSNGQLSVVTVMVDYDGPLRPFALLMPAPSDVKRDHVRAVKREFIARLEQLSAPRFHAFFEQDPCDAGPTEQDWDVRYEVGGAGFLAPEFLPPPERRWTVSNEISISTEPVFKTGESEFTFQVSNLSGPRELSAWLAQRSYGVSPEKLAALAKATPARGTTLIAEVNPERAELLADGGLQLGAIRYWTQEPVTRIAATLGNLNSSGIQDLFVYVLHPTSRFRVANYQNVVLPTNLEIEPSGAERVASLYNALFDARLRHEPTSVATEYVWPTTGCGEPCPNAPLTLPELLSLGGDVMEANLVSAAARTPEPEPESEEERMLFQERLLGRSAKEKAQALRQHARDRRELARRRAIMARQRYVMTRLHLRYDTKQMRRDLELEPVSEAFEGGIGIPSGPKGLLPHGIRPSKTSHYQVRFTSLFTWPHAYQCQSPVRWRWGRRWKSLDTALRQVHLATDLPRQPREQSRLGLIQSPIPELGIVPSIVSSVSAEPFAPAQTKPGKRSSSPGCATSTASAPPSVFLLSFVSLLAILHRIRTRWRAAGAHL